MSSRGPFLAFPAPAVLRAAPERLAATVRITVLLLLVAAPLAFGSVHPPAYAALLILASFAGLASLWRVHRRRAVVGARPLPGRAWIVALHALILAQLLPLPPSLLRTVSPGSFAFYDQASLLPLVAWRPISVSPADTFRGLLFLGGMSLLYAATYREFRETRRRRQLAGAVVVTGLVMTVVAFVQAASSQTRIYGLWRPADDWAVFGPYVNRNHFADYLDMAIPLAVALAAESLDRLRRSWARRGLLALGEPDGTAFAWRLATAMTLVAGLLGSGSRGGFMAFVAGAAALALALPTRRRVGAAVLALASLSALYWVGVEGLILGFETRGVKASRLDLWADAIRMTASFPVLGSGFNAFGTAYLRYQTFWPSLWVAHVHNEYLQALIDMGIAGAAILAGLLLTLFRQAFRRGRASLFSAGVVSSLLAVCVHNLVDANWQIPANAVTFAALAGLAAQPAGPPSTSTADR